MKLEQRKLNKAINDCAKFIEEEEIEDEDLKQDLCLYAVEYISISKLRHMPYMRFMFNKYIKKALSFLREQYKYIEEQNNNLVSLDEYVEMEEDGFNHNLICGDITSNTAIAHLIIDDVIKEFNNFNSLVDLMKDYINNDGVLCTDWLLDCMGFDRINLDDELFENSINLDNYFIQKFLEGLK